MKSMTVLLTCCLISICRPSLVQEPAETPEAVLQLLDQATGSWYVKLGRLDGACTVNSRANGRCVLVEGRRFADAISYTSLLGWYAPKQQILGLVIFENGESLLVRANVDSSVGKLTVQGDAVGVSAGQPVKATYTAKGSGNGWSVEVKTEAGETIQGQFRRTGGNR